MIYILLLSYIGNVFLNRWLNKILYKIDNDYPRWYGLWMTSLICTVCYLVLIALEKIDKQSWFTGKHW